MDRLNFKYQLADTYYPGAFEFSTDRVEKTLFRKGPERRKFIIWAASVLHAVYFPYEALPLSWTDEQLSSLYLKLFGISSYEITGFIDGSLLKTAQMKLWDAILFELHVIRKVENQTTNGGHPVPDGCGPDEVETPDDQLLSEVERVLAMEMPKVNMIENECMKIIADSTLLSKECPPAEIEKFKSELVSVLKAHPPVHGASQDDKSIVKAFQLLDDSQKVLKGLHIATVTLPQQIRHMNTKLPSA